MKHSQNYDHYYKYDEITAILEGYAEKHSDIAELTHIGVTAQGRKIWLMQITDKSTGDYSEKPAYYVEANIHAGEVTGCMTVMFFLDTIFTNRDSAEIKELLKNYTIYAVPRLSPDGSEHYLTTEDTIRSVPKFYPYDELQPGLVRKDMDGDGVARMMRVRSPYGLWKKSEKDDRLMVRRKPDETEGEFYSIFDEGYIEDFDGYNVKESPAKFGYDFNRNYPIGWETEDKQRGAGKLPMGSEETRANSEFLLNHPNVCFVLDMHTAGGQNLYTPGYKSAKKSIKEDIDLYKALGGIAKEENGYPVLNVFDDYMPASASVTYGGFDDFCHHVLGIPAIVIECWDLAVRAGIDVQYPPKENVSIEELEMNAEKYLKWADENVSPEEGFKNWTEFDHPQLGKVEIGGYNLKYFQQNPPIKFLMQEIEKHTRFMLRAIKTFPKLHAEKFEAKEIGGGVYKVEAVIGNRGYMPTYVFKEALKFKSLKGIKVALEGGEIMDGKAVQDIGHLEGMSGMNVRSNGLVSFGYHGAPMFKTLTWIVKGNKGDKLTLEVNSQKAGNIKTEITL